jgi:hypothetical protein
MRQRSWLIRLIDLATLAMLLALTLAFLLQRRDRGNPRAIANTLDAPEQSLN